MYNLGALFVMLVSLRKITNWKNPYNEMFQCIEKATSFGIKLEHMESVHEETKPHRFSNC